MRETENENPFGRSGHGRDGTSFDPHALLLHQLEVKMDELERSAATLRASENRFRTAFESSPIGLVIMNIDGKYLRVNQAFSRMLGYREEELIGRNYEEFTHPDDRAQNRATMHDFLRGERTGAELEKRFLRKDGSSVWEGEIENRRKDGTTFPEEMTITPVLDKTGQITHFVAVKKDVTVSRARRATGLDVRNSRIDCHQIQPQDHHV
ncbi:MAG: PAS domain S-box protein [Ignavibacteria bacterium]|nr:PAS domain S-box protein [Ignavibacteria bacterium]